MAKSITSIPTISKIEYLNTTDKHFQNPETIAILSCYLEGDQFKSFEVASIDFETGIIESKNGDLFRAMETESLEQIADQLNKRTYDISSEISSYEAKPDEIKEVMIEGDSLTIEHEGQSKSFRIVNMYYDISSDVESDIVQSKINEKQEEIERLRENPEANSEKIAELTESTNLASANIAEEGDKSLSMFKGADMTFILQDEASGEYITMHFKDLTYPDLSKMTGFQSTNEELQVRPDSELVSKLEEIKSEISKENTHHTYNFQEETMEISKFESLSIKGDKITGIADGRRVTFDLHDIEVSYSKHGLMLTHTSEENGVSEYLVSGVAKDCPAKSTETLFNTICDAKEVVSMSDVTMEDTRSKVMQEVASLSIDVQYSWEPNGKSPSAQYSLGGQKMSEDELKSNIYASEANDFVAIRIGNDTKILSTRDSSISKTSETISDIEMENGAFYARTQTTGKEIVLDYLDMQNGIAISNGMVYKYDEQLSIVPIGGGEINYSEVYINNTTNEIEQLVNSHASMSNKIINNWDIVSDKDTLQLVRYNPVIEDGKVVGMEAEQIREIKGIMLDETKGILRVKFDEGFAHLGIPADVTSENSVYQQTLEDGSVSKISMAEAIERSQNGISTVIEQVNTSLVAEHEDYTLITKPKELVRDVPNDCFVIVDKQLYYKEGDALHSKDGSIKFEDVRDKVDVAFNAPSTQELALLEKLSTQNLYTTQTEFRDIEKIDLISKETLDKYEAGRDISHDERLVVDTIASYEREFAHSNDVPAAFELD